MVRFSVLPSDLNKRFLNALTYRSAVIHTNFFCVSDHSNFCISRFPKMICTINSYFFSFLFLVRWLKKKGQNNAF